MKHAFCLLLLPMACFGQMTNRISQLPATNVVAGSNLLAIVTNPTATNGTKAVRVDNLFSNVTFAGSVTNVGGFTFWTTTFQTTDATTNVTAAQFPLGPDTKGKNIQATIAASISGTSSAAFGLQAWYYQTGGNWTNTDAVTLFASRPTAAAAVNARLTTSGTNAVVLVSGLAGAMDWRISLQVLKSP